MRRCGGDFDRRFHLLAAGDRALQFGFSIRVGHHNIIVFKFAGRLHHIGDLLGDFPIVCPGMIRRK